VKAQARPDERAASRLFRLDGTVRREPAIDAWIDAQPAELGALARTWFARMRTCGADVREVLHDDQPTACIGDAPFAYVDAFTAHVNVGFFRGNVLTDPAGLLRGTGKYMRHVKLVPGSTIDDAALAALIVKAYDELRRCLGHA
jgi:hypothetical protein